MTWTMIVLASFIMGILAGVTGLIPENAIPADTSKWLLYILIFQVGISIGSSDNLKTLFKNIDIRSLLVPFGTIAGSLIFAAAASIIFGWLTWADCMALASGFGYYSLSSVLITEAKTPQAGIVFASQLGTLALLANICRELTALGLAPLFRRYFGPYAPVAAAGVTSVDVLLPSIIRYSGKEMIPTAMANSFILELSVPFLVGTFCMM